MEDLTHLSLFSGIGGFDLAAEWAGFRTIGLVEKNPYRQRVLRKYWSDAPLWEDIRDVTEESLREAGIKTATLVTGGFPCQSFSVAGKRRGKADDRYLWPEMLGVIKILRPRWVLAENVAGIVRMALDTVLSDLESEGYSVQALVIPACAVNAPHRRDRVWIVAYSGNKRRGGRYYGDEKRLLRSLQAEGSGSADEQGFLAYTKGGRLRPQFNKITDKLLSENRPPQESEGGGGYAPDPDIQGLPDKEGGKDYARTSRLRTPGFPDWWESEPDVGRVADGVPHRVDRLSALGDAIVPQVAYQILKAIAQIEKIKRSKGDAERRKNDRDTSR